MRRNHDGARGNLIACDAGCNSPLNCSDLQHQRTSVRSRCAHTIREIVADDKRKQVLR